jgi:hypothetical protein
MKSLTHVKQFMFSATVAAATLWSQTAQASAAPVMYLQSYSGSQIPVGQMINVNVGEDSGTSSVVSATADITYPADKLEMRYVNVVGSVFQINAEQSGTTGHVHIMRNRYGFALTGSQHIATLTFIGKTVGPATITYDSTSQVMNQGNQSIGAGYDNLTVTLLPGGNIGPDAHTVATVSPTPAASPSATTTPSASSLPKAGTSSDSTTTLPDTGATALGATAGLTVIGGTTYAWMRSKRRLAETLRQA